MCTIEVNNKKSKCDYRFNRPLEEKEVRMLESAVNDVIALNLDVKESFVSRKEAGEKYNVSKLPENVGDKIRIIAVARATPIARPNEPRNRCIIVEMRTDVRTCAKLFAIKIVINIR